MAGTQSRLSTAVAFAAVYVAYLVRKRLARV
jgi:hypothetical protein